MMNRLRLWLQSRRLRDPNPAVRLTAVRAIGAVDVEAAADLLAGALAAEQPEEVRLEAAVSLGRRADLRALEPLAAMLAHGKATDAVLDALAALKSPEVPELLLGVLADPHAPFAAHEQAARGLKAVGAKPKDPEDRAFYHVAVGDYAGVSAAADVPHLLDLYEEYPDRPEFRVRVLGALAAVHDSAAVPPLFELLGHTEPGVRDAAEAALKTLTGEELDQNGTALAAVCTAMNAENPRVQQVAASLVLRAARATQNPDVKAAGDRAFRLLKRSFEDERHEAGTK